MLNREINEKGQKKENDSLQDLRIDRSLILKINFK
jgi:hypothetical protein